jgi:hypothetical protein
MLLWAAPFADAARLALVVGLDDYDAIPDLRNAAADAQAMGQALREVAYTDVQVVARRRSLGELQDDIRAFAARVRGADEVLFFFSGHGLQIGGDNYLLSSDVRAQNEAQVRDDALSLSRVLRDLRQRNPAFTLGVVDACRDNPLESLGRNIGGRGLTGVAGANGQMVVYAAGEGQMALDRLPNDPPGMRNGVFTRVLLQRMRQPGVPVPTVLRQVREEVYRLAQTIQHTQVPAIYDQVLGEFYFVPVSAPRDPRPGSDLEAEAWALCRDGRTATPCRHYLERYRAGRYDGLAQTRIQDFEAAAAPSPRPEATLPVQVQAPAGRVIKDCAECPEMVVIPAGSFVMGSPPNELQRDSDEGPQRKVNIGRAFALGRTEVSKREFATFVAATQYQTDAERGRGCWGRKNNGVWEALAHLSWRSPGFAQTYDHPVVCISWNDAQAYIRWLNGPARRVAKALDEELRQEVYADDAVGAPERRCPIRATPGLAVVWRAKGVRLCRRQCRCAG